MCPQVLEVSLLLCRTRPSTSYPHCLEGLSKRTLELHPWTAPIHLCCRTRIRALHAGSTSSCYAHTPVPMQCTCVSQTAPTTMRCTPTPYPSAHTPTPVLTQCAHTQRTWVPMRRAHIHVPRVRTTSTPYAHIHVHAPPHTARTTSTCRANAPHPARVHYIHAPRACTTSCTHAHAPPPCIVHTHRLHASCARTTSRTHALHPRAHTFTRRAAPASSNYAHAPHLCTRAIAPSNHAHAPDLCTPASSNHTHAPHLRTLAACSRTASSSRPFHWRDW
ncbi:hypothetical protein BU17DRAFT_80276 [Hysterangium stoloniferum]|nr:hypothetical protein BU17DRAFT_80276 [Hysterangium stoloniferum]